MKQLIFITIVLLATLACAYEVDIYSPPPISGEYTITAPSSMMYNNGDDLTFNTWNNSYNSVECRIINKHFYYSENKCQKFGSSCYEYTLDCTVKERTQFYLSDVKYTDLKGYRTDGTLKWSRDKFGSTDIYCYNKSGISIVKRVNDPYYCK